MLPIALRPDGRRAVVVGGGNVALRKARTLLAAGCRVTVVAPAIAADLRDLLEQSGGTALERAYETADLGGAFLAIAATGDDAVDARVVEDARAAGVLSCDASAPERGDFAMSAALRLGDLTIAVDSGASTPAFSKRVVREIEASFGPEYGAAARTLARMRAYVKAVLPRERRAQIMRALAELPVAALASMNPNQIEHEVEAEIERSTANAHEPRTTRVVCASRGSALALTQTRAVAARLAQRGIATTILDVTTSGDRIQDRAIAQLGSINVFVKELETALRERRADYAVHSCKDLPSELAGDMCLAAVSAREDARDAFCSERYASFEELPPGARVGTSSPRRESQLAALRPDLRFESIRGNVDTRLRKLRDGEFDAVVLAMAGLNRLRLRAAHTVPFSPEVLVPAAGQGALAIEVRAGEGDLANELRAAVNDDAAELCVSCERAVLRELRMGCNAPVGVYATYDGDAIDVCGAYVLLPDVARARLQRRARTLDDACALGSDLGRMLAKMISPEAHAPHRRGAAAPLAGRTVVLPRSQERPSRIAEALRAGGVDVVELREGERGPDPAERLPDMLLFPSSGSVAAASRYLERLRALARKPVVVAMGPQSGEAARAAGFTPDAVAPEASVEALVRLAKEHLQSLR